MRIMVAVDEPRGAELASGLVSEGAEVVAVLAADQIAEAAEERAADADIDRVVRHLRDVDVIVLQVGRASLTSAVVSVCDRSATRIFPLITDAADHPLVSQYGLEQAHLLEIDSWQLWQALQGAPLSASPTAPVPGPRMITVWGPIGSPGRSTIAIELATELARNSRKVTLVDADTHAPGLAMMTGMDDDGPGFAAACRHAHAGTLDARELERISQRLGRTGVSLLSGINRPSRWPELTQERVSAALEACRGAADYTVVDVAGSLEQDEEIISDLDGLRRNSATLAAIQASDLIVATLAADPVGVARFVRAFSDLRALAPNIPAVVLGNRLRPGSLGIDPRGQVRRTLDRFSGVSEMWFLPGDQRAADAAILAAKPISEVAARSPFTQAFRRFATEAIAPVSRRDRAGIRKRARAEGKTRRFRGRRAPAE